MGFHGIQFNKALVGVSAQSLFIMFSYKKGYLRPLGFGHLGTVAKSTR